MKALPESYTLLAVESSAGPASCALLRVEEGRETLLCSASVNTRLTHSQTLMPMIEDMLRNAGSSLEAVDALAVAVGPGSFTGVRIGVAAVKGWHSRTICRVYRSLRWKAWRVVLKGCR